MTSDIINGDELCEITGHKTREGLKTWLQQHKIQFLIARSGWPLVHRKALERAMGVTSETKTESAPVEFNFEALK